MDFGNIAAIVMACLLPIGIAYVLSKQAQLGAYKGDND